MVTDNFTSASRISVYRTLRTTWLEQLAQLTSKRDGKTSVFFKSESFIRRVLIVVTDEEWDIKKLKNTSGQQTDRNAVCELMHQAGYEPFAVVVRPNHFPSRTTSSSRFDFWFFSVIKKFQDIFCRNKSNNLKAYTDTFESDMKKPSTKFYRDWSRSENWKRWTIHSDRYKNRLYCTELTNETGNVWVLGLSIK